MLRSLVTTMLIRITYHPISDGRRTYSHDSLISPHHQRAAKRPRWPADACRALVAACRSSLEVDRLEVEGLIDENLETAHGRGDHCLLVLSFLGVRPENDLRHLPDHIGDDRLLHGGVHGPRGVPIGL